ncbi:HAMP domain-containing sensor histidine kinase [uncultured Gimesia sp.]|uniref:sensor histidine kinase n=1 Tax=uncultured Gimesia sp. TaxID=1678688 RepID=UPI0030DAE399
MAHEVNNPLAGIRNAFALFKADVPADHEHFELLELIDREIERISSITHLMYQLYRPTAQRSTSFSIGNIVEEVIRLLEPAARKAQVHVEREAAETDIQVTLPEGEVKQILLNLIQNAIQASAAGDTVSLQLSLHGETVKVQVVDQGSGIAEEHLPRIFDPFFSTKTGMPRQGMGLGLSVSRSLIEALGGSIDVVSSPGSGTRFTASFPRSIQAS